MASKQSEERFVARKTDAKSWTTASGRKITECDAVELAAEFEADDSVLGRADIAFPRRAGRPSLTGRSAVSPQITFRITPELREEAERAARQHGTTVSGLARKALEDLLGDREAVP